MKKEELRHTIRKVLIAADFKPTRRNFGDLVRVDNHNIGFVIELAEEGVRVRQGINILLPWRLLRKPDSSVYENRKKAVANQLIAMKTYRRALQSAGINCKIIAPEMDQPFVLCIPRYKKRTSVANRRCKSHS